MPIYRFTFDIDAAQGMKTSDQRYAYDKVVQYLKAVVMPSGSTIQTSTGAEVHDRAEMAHPVHPHDGDDKCPYCAEMSTDEIS
jgi:hypothetical protein